MSFKKTIDKAIRILDSKADLAGATPVGNGYVKDSGSEWIVYDVNGNIIGRFTTYDEAVRKAKEL